LEAVLIVIVVYLLYLLSNVLTPVEKKLDDPKSMSSQKLLSAIAKQASLIEKIAKLPGGERISMRNQFEKRKIYIRGLCLEILSRDTNEGQIFFEIAQKAKEIESSGVGKEVAAVQAVKEILSSANGDVFPTSWT
jgi:hypothetical protein